MKRMKFLLLFCIGFYCSGINLQAQTATGKKESLNMKQESIVAISAFTARGNLPKLKTALQEGLDAGISISEIKEMLVQLYAYTGFPRSLNALQTFMDVLAERKQKGIIDVAGKEPSPIPANADRHSFGTDMQTKLIGQPVKGALYDFAPVIDSFLKEHLFGDIFGRDNLDWKTRELVTVSALASMSGVENQLRSHFRVGMHNGLTEEELNGMVSVIRTKIGAEEGNTANNVLQSVLNKTDNKTVSNNSDNEQSESAIFPKGEKAPAEHFTGTAWVNRLAGKDASGTYSVGNVAFEAGARTNWHTHAAGQTLIVTEGTGWYVEKGKPARSISKGDVVVIPSGVEHWRSAAKNSGLTHIAITNLKGGSITWLQPVTEEQYNSINN